MQTCIPKFLTTGFEDQNILNVTIKKLRYVQTNLSKMWFSKRQLQISTWRFPNNSWTHYNQTQWKCL